MIVRDGIFVYLVSGEVMHVPTGTSVGMSAGALLVFNGLEQIGSIARPNVWSASNPEITAWPYSESSI